MMMMMMTMMLAATTTLTVVTGADPTVMDQCELLAYSDQCLPECGGSPTGLQCPLSDAAQEGWSKSLVSDVWNASPNDYWDAGVDNLNAVANASPKDYVNAVASLWTKNADTGVWPYPGVLCPDACSACTAPCGGNPLTTASCMLTACADWTPTNWGLWAKSAGIDDYNGTSTGTWSEEDADVVVPAAAGGDTAVTAASAEESASSSMGAASSLALLVVATVAVATTMMMMM